MNPPSIGQTLYARLPAWICASLLAVTLFMTLLPALPHKPLYIPGEKYWGENYKEPEITDTKLYKAIVADVADGAGYYPSAAKEHRARYYPTAPAQVFREPTLAWALAAMRFRWLRMASLFGLYGTLIVFFYRELLAAKISFRARITALTVAITGTSVIGVPDGFYWHEIWSALLIALSLLSYRKAPLAVTAAIGLLACLIREIAVPYLLVMAVFAIWQRRWKELGVWGAALLLFAIYFAFHIANASHLFRPGDYVSQGWLGLEGWDFSIATAKWNVFLHFLPYPMIALAICLSILGLAGLRDERAQRAALIVFGYVCAFLVVGRPDNFYWGILYAPFLSVGLIFAPAAVTDLVTRTCSLFALSRNSTEAS